MGRGNIFHITGIPDTPEMDATDFYDMLDTMHCDWVKDVDRITAVELLEDVLKQFANAGFELDRTSIARQTIIDQKNPCNIAFQFNTGTADNLKACQMKWFHGRYIWFQQEAAAITLEKFATDTAALLPIKTNMDDEYDDAVWLDLGTGPALYTFDRFIRNLQPDRTYYVKADIVYMH